MKTLTRSLLCLLAFLAACKPPVPSDTVPADDIDQHYQVIYTEEKNAFVSRDYEGGVTYALARLQNGHKSLSLGGGAYFRHNDAAMNFEPMLGDHKKIDRLETRHRFEYVDHRGRSFRNEVSLVPIGFHSGMPVSLSRSNSVLLRWKGTPLGKNEKVALTFAQPRGNQPGHIVDSVFTKTVGDDFVEIPSAFLSQFRAGVDAEVFLSRHSGIRVQQAADNASGSLKTSFYSRILFIRIDP